MAEDPISKIVEAKTNMGEEAVPNNPPKKHLSDDRHRTSKEGFEEVMRDKKEKKQLKGNTVAQTEVAKSDKGSIFDLSAKKNVDSGHIEVKPEGGTGRPIKLPIPPPDKLVHETANPVKQNEVVQGAPVASQPGLEKAKEKVAENLPKETQVKARPDERAAQDRSADLRHMERKKADERVASQSQQKKPKRQEERPEGAEAKNVQVEGVVAQGPQQPTTTTEANPFAVNPQAAIQGNAAAAVQGPRQVMSPQQIQQIVTQMSEAVNVIEHTDGKTDMVISLKHPPMMEGAEVKITLYSTAPNEYNIEFSNLSQQARELIESRQNQEALKQAMEGKSQKIHMIAVVERDEPLIHTEVASNEVQAERYKEEHEEQKRQQQQQDQEDEDEGEVNA